MALTDTAIRNAKPADKPYKLSDGGGMHLLVMPAGGKWWRVSYRYLGKQKTLSLGTYPEVSLAMARDRLAETKKLLASGRDPTVQAKLAKITRAVAVANTFNIVADEFLDKYGREGRAEATVTKASWLIDFVRADIGLRPISEVLPMEVLETLRKVERRGRLDTARRLRSTISCVFRYAIATGRATQDPTYALRGALTAPVTKSRAAITSPQALGGLLRAIDGFDGQPTTKAALQLLPLLFPRPGELRFAEWKEFDLEAAEWLIPAEHTKMRRQHRVPLSLQAVTVLRGLYRITGKGNLVLPSVRTVREPISENTLNAALRRMGYSKDEMTSHGFRATASTLLNESGKWHPDAIERQLAHMEANGVRRAYARGEHWNERVQMVAWWANYLDRLRSERPRTRINA
ncbi:MAG TPA: integrase arm-type DNA-binding domain-containing protein [Rhizomicrobium sp.]|jgi:integrase|nr:integrase arm-type DNA-binding domain-containing protein [Rhizomicrobium sp.]